MTGGGGTDSISWSHNWGADSLPLSEAIVESNYVYQPKSAEQWLQMFA